MQDASSHSSLVDVCERLRQQTTCKDFALSQPGTADATAHHKLSAQPFTVDAKLARSLARALLRGGSAATTDGDSLRGGSAATTDGDSLRGGSAATTDGDGKSFSAIWAARAAERACVAIGVLQGRDRTPRRGRCPGGVGVCASLRR